MSSKMSKNALNSTPAHALRWLARTGRWVVLGAISGLLAGIASFIFLEGLDRVTAFRTDRSWLLYLLPVAGLIIGLSNRRLAGRSSEGNSLLLAEIHSPTQWVPRRMAP